MELITSGQRSRWLGYTVNILLGLAFTIALLFITWNDALDDNENEFALESASLNEKFSHNVLVSNDVINNLDAFISANTTLSKQQYNLFTQEIFLSHPFIDAIIYSPLIEKKELKNFKKKLAEYSDDTDDVVSSKQYKSNKEYYLPVLYQAVRHGNIILPLGYDINSDNAFSEIIRSLFLSDYSAPIPSIINTGANLNYGIFKVLLNEKQSGKYEAVRADNIKGILSVIVNPAKYFGETQIPHDLSLALHSISSGISGKQLLYKKAAKTNNKSKIWLVTTLAKDILIQLPSYSIKLNIKKNIYWNDIEKSLAYIALLVGMGVTLLLVALVRAKDMQAKELRERNILIERTVKEQTEELAWARDKAIQGSLMKSEFLASMSHEIRTPLNAIIGMSELLSETELSSEQDKYISVFKRAGDTLLSLVNDILDLSKIEAHQLTLEEIHFNLVNVVEESAEIYSLKADEKNIELISRIDPMTGIHRIGDPGRLKQIILNLISNALKFTEQGEIIVNVGPVENSENEDKVKFSITDSGIGIAKEKLNLIFESFSQADSSTTRKYGGTGLGLTISKSLVELMEGKIWVESIEGEGSVFSFIANLPLDNESTRGILVDRLDLEGKNILIVDDKATNRTVVKEVLSAQNANITLVENGSDALQKINSNDFKLVIIDYNLQDMDGFQLAEIIKTKNEGANVAMMINPSGLNEQMARIKAIGIDSYLVKPIKQKELLNLVGNALSNVNIKEEKKNVIDFSDNQAVQKRLLLVDDNQDNRLLVSAYLKKSVYAIDEAENGQIAVELYKQNNYDVVLMDVQMPVMDGHKATRIIRDWEKKNNKPSTPVIALTAHATKEEIVKCTAAGCNSHLSKPVKKNTLLDALNKSI
jgi:signal transduction histidine kinase/DNA-binding response OmpR family regulator